MFRVLSPNPNDVAAATLCCITPLGYDSMWDRVRSFLDVVSWEIVSDDRKDLMRTNTVRSNVDSVVWENF